MRIVPFVFLLAAPLLAQHAAPPRTVELNGALLAQLKAHPAPAIEDAVRKEADAAMNAGPFSVMDKAEVPPSGDKHDYMSLAPYWWPNPNTKDGLPYIRHDGEVNPERYKIKDDGEINKLENAVHALGLGYYLTGDEKYADRAVLLLRTWFLAPATRMNPNLNFAQAVKGVNTGRGTGLIDVRGIPRLLDGIRLLSNSPALTKQDREGLRQWFTAYLNWLETSKNGQAESAAKNNHGSWFDQQITGVALFLGDTTEARKVDDTAETKRIALQIQPDGSEPLELVRTKSFSYSVFNLTALEWLAVEAGHAGVNLWNYRAPNGASIRTDLDYLLPYAQGEKTWTHNAINGVDGSSLVEPLLLAAIHYHDRAYFEDARKLEKNPDAEVLILERQAEAALGTGMKMARD